MKRDKNTQKTVVIAINQGNLSINYPKGVFFRPLDAVRSVVIKKHFRSRNDFTLYVSSGELTYSVINSKSGIVATQIQPNAIQVNVPPEYKVYCSCYNSEMYKTELIEIRI